MGRFYMYNGVYGPSQSYLATHKLKNFDPDYDTDNDDYEVEDDDEVYMGARICRECGASFTLADVLNNFDEIMSTQFHYDTDGYDALKDFDDDLCPFCAAMTIANGFDDDCEDSDEYDSSNDSEDEACIACGNPAYPECKSSCRLFDD